MSKIPMMPWFPDAHIADTSLLTLEQQGAYRLLLDHLWINHGYLKDDDKNIARLLRIKITKWKKLKPVLTKHLSIIDGKITQKRVLLDYNRVCNTVQKNAENGRKGGLKTQETRKMESAFYQANAKANHEEIARPRHISESLKYLKPEL